jgi:hypothetical protein
MFPANARMGQNCMQKSLVQRQWCRANTRALMWRRHGPSGFAASAITSSSSVAVKGSGKVVGTYTPYGANTFVLEACFDTLPDRCL